MGFHPADCSFLGPYQVVPIHKHPTLMSQCCHLINSEWPRSEVARMRSLEASCDQLPTSLVLTDDGCENVLAHLKLSPIPSRLNSCFVESLVVDRELRGQGLGKLLMRYAEEYAADFLMCNTVYLSTIDKVGFYEKLCYAVCQPINMYGPATGHYLTVNKRKIFMKKMLT